MVKKSFIEIFVVLMLILSITLYAASEKQSQSKAETPQQIYQLGMDSFRKTNGTKKDKETAGQYFKLACDLGDVDACLFLAHSYEDGLGIGMEQRSDAKAREFYQKACGLGDKGSCSEVDSLGGKK